MNETKDTSTHYDDDFQFDDFDTHENTSAEEAKTKPAAGFADMTMNNKPSWDFAQKNPRRLIILAIVIVIVIGFIIYHFVSNWSNPFDDLSGSHAKIAKMETRPAPEAVAPPVPAAQQPAPAVSTETENRLNNLDQTITQQQQTVTQLQANMSALQDSVNSLNSTVTAMSQQLATINDKLTKPVAKKAVPLAPPPPPSINYTVKAMVPGRAWLQSSDGQTLSVIVGNEVPTHGTVTNVDLNAGQVTTSDGSVFIYDTNAN